MSDEMELEATPEVPEVRKGKPGPKPKAKPADSADRDLISELMTRMQTENRETLLQLTSELRKPTELEQKKLDDERAQRLRRAQMSIAAARQKERADLALQAQCRSEGHANPNGGTRFRAQVNSDGYFVPVCIKCRIELPKVKATPEEIQNGVMLGNYKMLTEDALRQLALYRAQPTVQVA